MVLSSSSFPLPVRNESQQTVQGAGGYDGGAFSVATGAQAAALAGESHEGIVAAFRAAETYHAEAHNAAFYELLKGGYCGRVWAGTRV